MREWSGTGCEGGWALARFGRSSSLSGSTGQEQSIRARLPERHALGRRSAKRRWLTSCSANRAARCRLAAAVLLGMRRETDWGSSVPSARRGRWEGEKGRVSDPAELRGAIRARAAQRRVERARRDLRRQTGCQRPCVARPASVGVRIRWNHSSARVQRTLTTRS